MPMQFSMLDTGHWILDFLHRVPSIQYRVPSVWFLLVCCIFCFGSSGAFAEKVEPTRRVAATAKRDDEASENKVTAWSTLPYLKRLGRERVQRGALHLYLSTRDARVYLDDKPLEELERHGVTVIQSEEKGKTLLTFENLIPGTHTLRVTKRSHNTSLKCVLIEPDGETAAEVRLHSRWRFFAAEMLVLASLAAIGVAVSILV